MAKEQTFYMALPKTEREKLRERQKLRVYREYTKNMTAININAQMDAESDYLRSYCLCLSIFLLFSQTERAINQLFLLYPLKH